MSRKAARQQQALASERERRQAADRRRFERQQHVEQAATDAGLGQPPPIEVAVCPRTNPATQPLRPGARRAGSGRRTQGQQVTCGWCGQPVVVRARGPLPKWCSPACRHRAWEQDRAARSGRAAVTVVDRYVIAVPDTGPAWSERLATLADQISAGPRPIADHPSTSSPPPWNSRNAPSPTAPAGAAPTGTDNPAHPVQHRGNPPLHYSMAVDDSGLDAAVSAREKAAPTRRRDLE